METIANVGKHDDTRGKGHYEATVFDDGSVSITTILDASNQTYSVKLSRKEWERLTSWVASMEATWHKGA